jgi:hypothetical protein
VQVRLASSAAFAQKLASSAAFAQFHALSVPKLSVRMLLYFDPRSALTFILFGLLIWKEEEFFFYLS